MKKALMIASVASMIDKFNMSNIAILEDLGYKVDVAANFAYGSITSDERVAQFKAELTAAGRKFYHVDIPRSITKVKEILSAYKMVKTLCDENKYDVIHCHSPIGSVIARLAAIDARKHGTKMIYTAHGFHFFRGASIKNWLLYYPVEKVCAHFTDLLITINQEDFDLAKKKMPAKKVAYVPGIGVDTEKFSATEINNDEKRRELGLKETDKVILSVGEVSVRKNHEVVVRALAKLGRRDVKYLIGGFGAKEAYLRELAESLGVSDQLMLLGYRSDVAQLLNLTDIYAFPSLQEGLPVALMEAMSVGKSIVCSRIRGNTDLIEDGVGGFLLEPTDVDGFANAICRLLEDDTLRVQMAAVNKDRIQQFSTVTVDKTMREIYVSVSEG